MVAKKIKIAHVITRMDRGGAPDIVRILFQRLDPEKFDLTLIYGQTLEPSEKSKEFLNKLGERAIVVPTLRRNINPFYDFFAFICLLNIFLKRQYDIVHLHTAKAGFLGRLAARLAGVKRIIYSLHGQDFYGYFGSLGSALVILAERFAAVFCDKIHALTNLEKRDLAKFGICKEQKIEVIYSGVELDLFREARFSRKDDKFLHVAMVARLEPIKGPQYFIEAAILVLEKSKMVKFLVVGDGSLRAILEDRVRESKLGDFIIFKGWQEDVVPIYQSIDILVMPSLNEGVGMSVLEAQAAGVPVVASRVGGMPEVICDGKTGVLVAPRDPKALAEKIVYLLENEQTRREMAINARHWVDDKFSYMAMVEKFSGLYEKMMQTL